jgi:hypothetical protein
MRAVSDLDLERFLVGELSGAEQARVAAAIAADDELQRHVAARRASQAAFAVKRPRLALPPPTVAERLRSAWRAWFAGAAAAAAVGAALLLWMPGRPVVGDEPPIGIAAGVRARGTAAPVLIVKRGDRVFRFQGEPLRAGDAVRLEVSVAEASDVVLYVVDAHGAVSALLERPERVAAGVSVLPGSFVLDDAVGPEQWLLAARPTGGFAREAPATLVPALAVAFASGAPSMPALQDLLHAEVSVIAFEKEPPP